MLVGDFHVHTTASSDGLIRPSELVETAEDRGLSVLAVCDHGTLDGALEARAHSEARGGRVLIIVGEEIATLEGEIIGYFLERPIRPGLSVEETIEEIERQNGVVCVPHPFDRLRRSPLATLALERVALRVGLVEAFNARSLVKEDNARARDWAQARGVPTTAGSDAHWSREIGNVQVALPEFGDPTGFLAALQKSAVSARSSGIVPHAVTAWTKRVRGRSRG